MNDIEMKISAEFERVSAIETAKNPYLDGCIMDGIIDESAYMNSRKKCCFILKEAYDDFDNEELIGGGWSFSNILKKWDISAPIYRRSSLSRVSALVYSFNHGFCDTPELTSEQLRQGFAACYWVNLSKTPAKTATPYNQALKERVKLWSQLVQYQLIHANPDIILFGNTWDWHFLDYPYHDTPNSIKSYHMGNNKPLVRINRTDEGKIQVDAYHPGRKGMVYESQIISSLKDYLSLD